MTPFRHPPLVPGSRSLALALLSACLCLPPAAQAQPMGADGDDFLYKVQVHDTLEQIARRYTLQPALWKVLQRLNQIADPLQLPIGKTLHIPLSLIPERPAAATVVHVTGTVTADGRPLKPGDVLHAGQTLRSAETGSATLQLEDQSLLTLPPDTTLRLQHLQAFEGTGLTDTRIGIDRGTLESSVSPAHTGVGRFEVLTPATVTGVRGTRLRIHADASGSRHELLQGSAAIDGPAQKPQYLAPDQGAAYDAKGTLLAMRPLLPAPQGLALSQDRNRLNFEPVPQASAYEVRITLDAEGARLVSREQVAGPGIPLHSRSSAPRYVFVRGIDTFGIEGQDAVIQIPATAVLLSGDGVPVLSSDGAPVMLD
jgi:hypothetical protein